MKPPITCKLQKGKLIDVQRNFVDTFNWLVDFASNLKGVSGIKIEGIDQGRPNVSLILTAGSGINLKENKNSGGYDLSLLLEAGDGIKIDNGSDGAVKISATAQEGREIAFAAAAGCNIHFDKSSEGNVDTYTVGVYWSQS